MIMNSKFKTAFACLLLLACGQITVLGQDLKEGFVPLFDGKTLNGWKVAEENPQSWKVVDGQLVCEGPRCHLFYDGKLAPFKNFHFIAEVKTTPGSNAGIYFHTKYQATDWPRQGFECQVNVSHKDPKRPAACTPLITLLTLG